jgi:hypothetical protein
MLLNLLSAIMAIGGMRIATRADNSEKKDNSKDDDDCNGDVSSGDDAANYYQEEKSATSDMNHYDGDNSGDDIHIDGDDDFNECC